MMEGTRMMFYQHNPKRRYRRAVGSHSKYGETNYNALSSHIPGELKLHHTERKSFILPCGKTLAKTWGALRKSWLGFKIAKSHGDFQLMKHYAEFIVKLQNEIGIPETKFYTEGLIQNQITSSPHGEEQPGSTPESEEREDINSDDFEYEVSLPTAPNCYDAPAPSEQIFSKYIDRKQKSCSLNNSDHSEHVEPIEVNRRVVHFRQACPASSLRADRPSLAVNVEDGVFYPKRSEVYCSQDVNSHSTEKDPFWAGSNFGERAKKTNDYDRFAPMGSIEITQNSQSQINKDFEQSFDSSRATYDDYCEYDPNGIIKSKRRRKTEKNRSANSCYYKQVDRNSCYYRS